MTKHTRPNAQTQISVITEDLHWKITLASCYAMYASDIV